MDWHWHNADSSLQEQSQDLSGAEEIEMSHNLNSAPEYNELDAIFGDLSFFLPSQELSLPSHYYTGHNTLSTSSSQENTALDLQSTSQKSQIHNYGGPSRNQDSSSDVR